MMTSLLMAVLAATPGQVKLASPGLTGVEVKREAATFYSDHLAQQLALHGLSVMTATEISSLIGLERQKQLLGCSSEASSCMAELADALGVDGIVTGSVAKLDATFQVDVKVVASADGRKLAIFSGNAKSERDLLELLTGGAATLSDQVLVSLGRKQAEKPSLGARKFWWGPVALGVVGAGVGTAMMVLVNGHYNALRGSPGMPSTLDYESAKAALSTANTQQIIGITAFAVGGVALAAGALMYFLGSSTAVVPTVTGSGAGLSLVTELP